MPSKKLKIANPKTNSDIVQKIVGAKRNAYRQLLDFCLHVDQKNDESIYLSCGTDFSNGSEKASQEIERFQLQISSFPLIAVILLWARNSNLDKVFGARHIMIMQELLENGLIQYRHSWNDELTSISEFAGFGHQTTIDRIRCYKEWSIDKREDYVKFYVEFANWLSETSFGLISKAFDPDRSATLNRWLPFDIYIRIIMGLADRERIMAKLFYLGGARSLEEVLSLKIEDIDFEQSILHLSGDIIRYPKHVFEDLREYIGTRKTGAVFIGRQGDRVDHTVPYRALKTVIKKLKLDSSFTFKEFVRNL